jgi:hypothetical protein
MRQASLRHLVAVVLLAGAVPSPGLSQPIEHARSQTSPSADGEDPEELSGLAEGPYSTMSALLEVTIFEIDVLTLTVRVGPEGAARLAALAAGREYSEALADSVASVLLDAERAWARQVFMRDVSFGRLLGGMRETARKAAEAEYITEGYYEQFSENLPVWFGFLEETGVKKGDQILFSVRGDSLRTVFRTLDGRVLLDRHAEGAEARRASIPSFFAPGTRFRKRLVESLLTGDTPEDRASG